MQKKRASASEEPSVHLKGKTNPKQLENSY